MKGACLTGYLYYFWFAAMYNEIWVFGNKKVKKPRKGQGKGVALTFCASTRSLFMCLSTGVCFKEKGAGISKRPCIQDMYDRIHGGCIDECTTRVVVWVQFT